MQEITETPTARRVVRATIEILFVFGLVKLVRETPFPGSGNTRRADTITNEGSAREMHLIERARMLMDRGAYQDALNALNHADTGTLAKMTLMYECLNDGKGCIVDTFYMPPLDTQDA